MDKKKIISIGLLPFMWFLYFLFELITGRVDSSYNLILNLVMCILFALVGFAIYKSCILNPKGFTPTNMSIIFFILLGLDQGVKFIIKMWFFDKEFYIIKNFLSFNPIINTQGSWLNVRFNANVSFTALIILNIVALFLIFEIYRYYLHLGHKDSWSDLCMIFILSGSLCSLIDKVFYGGSLDFIGISNLFIADFKDIYIDLAIFLFLLSILYNEYFKDDDKSTFKDDIESFKKFLSFLKSDVKSLFSKK